MDVVCIMPSPSSVAMSRNNANAASTMPHIVLILPLGCRSPSQLYIPSTKVAELAEVTKNVTTSKRQMPHMILPRGYWRNTTKHAVAEFCEAIAQIFSPRLMPIPPMIANQITESSAGTMSTPAMNSLTVLPLEILAMKHPQNGAHATHHFYSGEFRYYELFSYCTLYNQSNPMEQIGMCILNPFHNNRNTLGFMYGISYNPITPFALKFLISINQIPNSELKPEDLELTKSELKTIKNLNMMLLNTQEP